MIRTSMSSPMNNYHGKGASWGKSFLLNVITSLIWNYFQMAIFLLAFVVTFPDSFIFGKTTSL